MMYKGKESEKYICNGIILLYIQNQHNTVSWVYSNYEKKRFLQQQQKKI